MIEVLFAESEAGSMKFAKSQQKRGSGGKVIELAFDLDMGDISGDLCGEARKAQCLKKFSQRRMKETDPFKQQSEKWNYLLLEVERLKACASKGEPFRIWYSSAPYSMCGFYHVCNLLADYDCLVSVVRLPEYASDGSDMVIHSHWGEVEDMLSFVTYEKPLCKTEMNYYGQLWEELKRENAPLRAMVNGNLVSVAEDFYDFFIESCLPDRPFQEVLLIGQVVSAYQMSYYDDLIMERIQKMIDDGKLEVVWDKDVEWTGDRILSKKGIMVSCCGVNCKECEYFGHSCEGCDLIKGKPFWIEYTGDKVCELYHCCIEQKQFSHCGICPQVPCDYYDQDDPTKSQEENEADFRKQMDWLKKL